MFELLSATQANSVLPVELPHCVATIGSVSMVSATQHPINPEYNLGFNELPPKRFTFDATANLGFNETIPPKPR